MLVCEALIQARGLLRDNDSSANSTKDTCPHISLAEDASQPLFGTMSFYTFNMILSGSFAAASCLIIFTLMILHATHLSKSNEQIKILRISLIIPFWSIISFLSICFPTAEVYLHPWLEFVQSICLATFFLLLCEFVSPSEQHRDVFFAGMTVKNKKAANGEENGLQWYRKMWFAVFQYPVVALLVAILTAITQAAGVYCEFESKVHFARLWLQIIGTASLTIALMTVIRFFMQLRTKLSHHQPLAKFFAFKLVVTLTFLENIIFWILKDTGVLNPTATLTDADLRIGIPSMLICIEMLPLAAFFHYAYSHRPYVIGSGNTRRPLAGDLEAYEPQTYSGGPGGVWALVEMWNPMEIVEAIVFGLKMKTEERKQSRAKGRGWQSTKYQSVEEPYEMGRR
ncbi:organic solute transporter Ostalpha-domain-containing protein [Colletotrichum acutatum]|uniref:Organic solute transporter Ostalpha-domain-containing protein n=1 Tax=Glomerella acutata TaxID=27357 RepID=A0AAD8XFV3_GLOAC|nr:organic solute transporter Ostalpha-domain-containing protein [Colletotrichum acutatum]KAK1721209.1 organic solute transporter Ostalpha-domain-containing protein [Colletotrichum acutatum]